MKIEIIKDYINQEGYKNKVFADYLKDNLDDTISFISTCSKEEFEKALYALKCVALYFNDDSIVKVAEKRAEELSVSCSSTIDQIYILLYSNYYDEFKLIKPIVDDIDPLGFIEKNNKLYSYDTIIKELCKEPILLFDLDNKLNRIFNNANKEKLSKLSEQIKSSLKDGSAEKILRYKPEDIIYYYEIDDETIGVIAVNFNNKNCKYFECSNQCLGGCDEKGNYYLEFYVGELYVKLLCNEFLNTKYDLDECRKRDYKTFLDGTFQTFSTYKNGKQHMLVIDSYNKRYIYDVLEINYYDCLYNRNEFIFDAIFNGIKKLGFKEFVLKEED